MARKVDLDDLLDAAGVADVLGLKRASSVAVYRRRYDDFPAPVVERTSGRCQLWHRVDVERWARRTGRSA